MSLNYRYLNYRLFSALDTDSQTYVKQNVTLLIVICTYYSEVCIIIDKYNFCALIICRKKFNLLLPFQSNGLREWWQLLLYL